MPDLNLTNPEVTDELTRIAEVWLEDVGIDGFRIDAAKHLIETGRDAQINTPETKAWLADFRGAIHAGHPDALVLTGLAWFVLTPRLGAMGWSPLSRTTWP